MLCERCKKKKAVMFYNENINGRLRSFHLCADCAAAMQQSGELEDMSAPLSAFSSPLLDSAPVCSAFDDGFSLSLPDLPASVTPSKACPVCHTTQADLIKERKAGCPACYNTFFSELSPTHGRLPYNGKVPRSHRQKQELCLRITALRQQLTEAVREQRFESAATLRDQIRDMEQRL